MDNLKRYLLQHNIQFDDITLKKFEGYMLDVLSWNEKINLTNILDPKEFVIKHYIDSIISSNTDIFKEAVRIIDVGTGAGFPGIPLAILNPDKEFVLMDSLLKRLKIIDELCAKYSILNVKTVHARAEELAHNNLHRENYDLCVSRAVANLSTLSEYCLPFISKGGYLISYKGPEAEKEYNEARKAIRILGGELTKTIDSHLEEFDIHHKLLVIKKISDTPGKYPRKAGTPSKEPIR